MKIMIVPGMLTAVTLATGFYWFLRIDDPSPQEIAAARANFVEDSTEAWHTAWAESVLFHTDWLTPSHTYPRPHARLYCMPAIESRTVDSAVFGWYMADFKKNHPEFYMQVVETKVDSGHTGKPWSMFKCDWCKTRGDSMAVSMARNRYPHIPDSAEQAQYHNRWVNEDRDRRAKEAADAQLKREVHALYLEMRSHNSKEISK